MPDEFHMPERTISPPMPTAAPDPARPNRTLGLSSVLLFGLAYMTPIEVLGIYGTLTEVSQGHTALAYIFALLAMLLTAVSYARLARRYPETGAAYNYARRAIHPAVGFLVGWATLLDYCFIPLVCWTIGATYLHETFPFVPTCAWMGILIMATTAINIMGISGAARLNIALMSGQLLLIAIFLALCLNAVLTLDALHSATVGAMPGAQGTAPGARLVAPFMGLEIGLNTGLSANGMASSALSATMAGAAIAAYSFLGFDALGTLSEETIAPRKTMPRAIVLTVVCGGLIFVLCAYSLQLASMGHSFDKPLSATLDIATAVGGRAFVAVMIAGLIVAEFAAGVVAQATVGRLIYAIARDGMLPGRIFCSLHARFKTPVGNILLSAIFGTLAVGLSLRTILAFISFGAFLAFAMVNLCVIRLYMASRARLSVCGVIVGVLLPACGAIADIWLLMQLEAYARWIGGVWLALGAGYLCWRTRCFTRALPTSPLP